jgi:benzylsuccinate CoA-transferase BbsF subunit
VPQAALLADRADRRQEAQGHRVTPHALNLRSARGRELLERLVRISDVVTENFAAGVMERLGFGYERLRELRPAIVYVSNSGFGASRPYRRFKTWGPIVQAISGVTFTSGLPDREPAGWGFSYMDHTGSYCMAIAILSAAVVKVFPTGVS